MAGGVVTVASSPATTPPVVGEPSDPTGLGDDPANDALAQSCFDGDLESCDDLYWGTSVGSDYETYGSTCGGRLVDGVFGDCVETIGGIGTEVVQASTLPEPTLEPTGLGTDPELDPLATDCYAGVMFACDKLFVLGEEGTPYYNYGLTCAGRQAADADAFCHELVGFPGPGVDFASLPAPEDDAVFTLIATCAIGDMQTCDDLYRQSEPTSEYRTVGDTCAGRQPENTGALCVNAFPAWEQLSVVPDGTDSGSITTVPAGPAGEPTDPTGLGDDVAFNTLAQNCFEGDFASCDDLYWRSDLGSEYETYGATCGGRLAERISGGCAEQLGATAPTGPVAPPPTQEPTGLGTDPALDALAQDCYDGAMFACDKLFFDAAGDTDPAYSEYGDSCAGRQAIDTGLYCHELVGFPAPTADVSQLPDDEPKLMLDSSLCLIGDMAACDDIYRAVAEDSPFREFADTCAGRQAAGTGQYCTATFPEWEQLQDTSTNPTPTTPTTTTVVWRHPGSDRRADRPRDGRHPRRAGAGLLRRRHGVLRHAVRHVRRRLGLRDVRGYLRRSPGHGHHGVLRGRLRGLRAHPSVGRCRVEGRAPARAVSGDGFGGDEPGPRPRHGESGEEEVHHGSDAEREGDRADADRAAQRHAGRHHDDLDPGPGHAD